MTVQPKTATISIPYLSFSEKAQHMLSKIQIKGIRSREKSCESDIS